MLAQRWKILLCIFFMTYTVQAGITGKISGKIIDAGTKQPLVGVNVLIQGTYLGASSDANGEYYIINIPVGTYTLKAQMIGYKTVVVHDVRVKSDLTTTIDISMEQTVLELGETVEVIAERPIVQKDITSGRAIVSSKEIEAMPVENFTDVLATKAGITTGAGGELHIRGGRSSEIGYMVDGIPVSDPIWGGMAVNVENSVIQELQVVSGTFNAEYGQAMSGIVNIITKDGGSKFTGDLSLYLGDYISNHTKEFMNIDDIDLNTMKNLDLSLSGPVPFTGNKITFFTSTRQYHNDGYIYGKREHNPWDAMYLEDQAKIQLLGEPWWDTNENGVIDWDDYGRDGLPDTNDEGEGDGYYQVYESGEPFVDYNYSRQFDTGSPYADKIVVMEPYWDQNENGVWDEGEPYYDLDHNGEWTSGYSGDNQYVPLEPYTKSAYQAKLTFRITPKIKLRYNLLYNKSEDQNLPFSSMTHAYKYNPDGRPTDHTYRISHMLDFSHTLSQGLYYTLKYTTIENDFKRYLYKDWQDPRYMPGVLRTTYGFEFLSGGTYNGHSYRNTRSKILDFDITYQMNNTHQFKAGLERKVHDLDYHAFTIVINNENNWQPERYTPENSTSNDQYLNRSPKEFAVYIQDKIELRDMIINLGLRYDRFDPNWVVPLDPRDERLKITNRLSMGELPTKPASVKHQFSPRLGIAYPITDRGIIHFSYGHFFQIPPFAYLYSNPEFEVSTGRSNLLGNADLNPQKTVTYELGLQQGLTEDIRLEVIGYYKDIKDLTSTDLIYRLPSGDVYSQYTNRDYGNVKGITINLEKRRVGLLGFSLDYTFQIAEGNNSDPNTAYYNNQSDPPRATVKKVLPLNWDQTHTLNFVVNMGVSGNWGATLIGRYSTGQPYTPQFQGYDLSNINSARKPDDMTFDLYTFKEFHIIGNKNITFFLKVYNLFDRLNERYVFDDTGRATYSLIPTYTSDHGDEYGRHSLEDYLNRNWYYSSPRQVRMGFSIGF